jgi:ribosome biogenesis GTPase
VSTPEDEVLLEGIVVRTHGAHCLVRAGRRTYRCPLRGRLKRGPRQAQTVVVVGDRVRVRPLANGASAETPGVIETVLPRRNRISRRAPQRAGGRREQIIMANLDQVVAVQSLREPAPQSGFVDRLLAAAEHFGVAGVLCLNKVDLDPEAARDPRWSYYADLGYAVLRTSALTGEGLEQFREQLCGAVSLLLGASGVGKSSLLNRLQPGLDLRVAAVGEKSGLGRHTTTGAQLFALDCGGYLADSPGLRGFALWDVEPRQLRDLFVDFRTIQETCRFRSCLHRDEPHCGVKEAVAGGRIPCWRHSAYLALLADVEACQE